MQSHRLPVPEGELGRIAEGGLYVVDRSRGEKVNGVPDANGGAGWTLGDVSEGTAGHRGGIGEEAERQVNFCILEIIPRFVPGAVFYSREFKDGDVLKRMAAGLGVVELLLVCSGR